MESRSRHVRGMESLMCGEACVKQGHQVEERGRRSSMMAMPSRSSDRALLDSTATPVAVEGSNATKLKNPPVPPLCHHQAESSWCSRTCQPSATWSRPRTRRRGSSTVLIGSSSADCAGDASGEKPVGRTLWTAVHRRQRAKEDASLELVSSDGYGLGRCWKCEAGRSRLCRSAPAAQ